VPEPELVKQVEGTPFPTVGLESQTGTIQRPSPKFWDAYARAVSMKLPPEMVRNIDTVASLSWYNYLDDKQKQDFIDRFTETGSLEIPDDAFDITRNNPKAEGVSAMSGTEKSAAALSEVTGFARMLDSPELMGLAIRFWDAKEYDADYEGMHLSVRLHDWETRPFEKGAEKSRAKGEIHEVRATVGGVPVAELQSLWPDKDKFISRPNKYMMKPPARFKLTLYDAGYYSHSAFKSFVKHPSPVLAVAIERILMDAPTNVGHIWLKDDVIGYSLKGGGTAWLPWSKPDEHKIMFETTKLSKKFIAPFWKAPIVRKGKPIKELPMEESDLDRVQAKIDAKELVFTKYIEKLYVDDVELGKKLEMGPTDVARLMGDTEYEDLLKQRDELMWAELPTATLEPL
jgi:hypothetical protein